MTAKKAAQTAVLLAVALILGFVENLLPPIIPILPYAKIGLGNAAVLLALIWLGVPYAALIMLLKCVIIGLFSGAPTMILYSLGGGVLSFAVMALLLRLGANGVPAISAAGGIMHNVGQILVAIAFTGTAGIAVLLVYLALFGLIAGALIGVIVYFVDLGVKRAEKVKNDRT
ncbi:MAG: Gx transporter family protein [Clostridia bacterium]|nr:Gx transporter family protein [Clostridia bacterium]